MDQRTLAKHANALITFYVSQYTDRYGTAPRINRYKEKWGFQDVIESVGVTRARELLEYYFRLDSRSPHPVQWFLYNFDKLDDALKEQAEDDKKRAALRAETEKRVKEWNAKHRSNSNQRSM